MVLLHIGLTYLAITREPTWQGSRDAIEGAGYSPADSVAFRQHLAGGNYLASLTGSDEITLSTIGQRLIEQFQREP